MTSKDKPALSLTNPLLSTASPRLTGLTSSSSLTGKLTGGSSLSSLTARSEGSSLKSTLLTSQTSQQKTTLSSPVLTSSLLTKPATTAPTKLGQSSLLAKKDDKTTSATSSTLTPTLSLTRVTPLSGLSLGPTGTKTKPVSSLSSSLLSNPKLSTQQPLTNRALNPSSLVSTKIASSSPSSLFSTKIASSSPSSLVSTKTASSAHSEPSTSKPARLGAPQSVPALVTVPIAKELEAAPSYHFSLDSPEQSEALEFVQPELDPSLQKLRAPLVDVVGLKSTLVNAVATSLLCSPNFHSPKDATFVNLCAMGEKVSAYDAEFLLKLALYTRCDLNIRTTANFLLALASKIQSCRPYLRKYYSSAVALPSDWIEVAEIYTVFHDDALNFASIPTALRKVMAVKFTEFDAYQLGKYNKESSKKKHKKKEKQKEEKKEKQDGKGTKGKEGGKQESKAVPKGRGKGGKMQRGRKTKPEPEPKPMSETEPETPTEEGPKPLTGGEETEDDSSVVKDEQDESEAEIKRLSFTLKQLVRKIHISEPVEHVMCLIGKSYPEDPEAFRRSRLPGTWDQDRAGKRMKLSTPETWETQVSLKGNKAGTWEELIDHSKLPFMAMLRNLRNLILADISPKHHQWVINKLNDERAVTNSKQFPFRFFSAYEVLGGLEKIARGEAPEEKPQRPGKPPRKGKPRKVKPLPVVDPKLIERYRTALDSALKIATCYNVKPISGTTVILCNVGSNMNRPCTAAKGLGKPRTVLEVGILLGLMCKFACEQCSMMVFGQSGCEEVNLKDGTILNNMDAVLTVARSQGLNSSDGKLPASFLQRVLVDRVPIDNLVLLTDTMRLDDEQGELALDFLNKYRHLVNPNLLFVSVDLSGRFSGLSSTIKPQHENDIHLAGYSDQILRFIAERGDSGQLTYVENIDKAYELQPVKLPGLLNAAAPSELLTLEPEKALLSAGKQKRWRTVRIFISSTFRDMHGERDMLTRFVFPEIRARARARNIQVYEVDLRWGVTETDARSHKALEICLDEISHSQYFIGLLGQRYGWVQDEYWCPDTPEYDWLREYPAGRSITELEMHHAALCNPDKVTGKAFFYFRHPSVSQHIPQSFRADFESESHESAQKIEGLKSQIRTSGLEVYDGYSARWLGEVDGKPMVGGLEDFGMRVLHNIWNAIQRDYPDDEAGKDAIAQVTAMHEAFAENQATSFVGRKAALKQVREVIEEGKSQLVLAVGKPGSGKSAFMAAYAQQFSQPEQGKLAKSLVLSHFIGAAPGSGNVSAILSRLCHEMKRRFALTLDIPADYPDLVMAWPTFLEESSSAVGKERTLLVLIDGLDLLEDTHNGRAMDWLPPTVPKGVVILLSTTEGGPCHSLLKRRTPVPTEVTVGSMDMSDKAQMVRQKLARHRKTLDESAFNNQLKLLLTKKDAGNPLYLHLACEELRVFGVFEEVTEYLKQIPATTSILLQEVLKRLESELGAELISTSLSLLCLVRNGLLECELAALLAMLFNKNSVQAVLPPMVVTRLLRSLQGFLQPTGQENSDRLSLAHKDIEKAVRLRYMQGAASDKERQLHQLLARYFRDEADPSGDKQYKGNNGRAFCELPYHLVSGGLWSELEEIVTNLCFVLAKCRLGLAQELLSDYSPSVLNLPTGKVKEVAKFVQLPRVQLFKSFVSRNLHVLVGNPTLALQQAVNEPSTSDIAKEGEQLAQETRAPLLRWINKLSEASPCRLTIAQGGVVATCVAVSQDGKLLATGLKSCVVKLYEVETGKELQMFVGHAAAITGICFVGTNALCTASHDTTLSLWNVQDGFRVAVMKGHQRSVRGCAANSSGKVVVSVSWDTTIRVWNGSDGKCVSTLRTPRQRNNPLNCVAFHPEGQLVVVGSWDASLKVWDTYNQKRVKTLKGHKTSVQACAYAPTGRHIVSAALDGEVRIWSTKSDTAVGTIAGHHDPVNSITFTPNGQYLVTASSDKLLKVWSGTLGQPVASLGSAEFGFAHCMTFHSPTQTVRVGYHDGHVRSFNVQTGAVLFASKLHSAAVVGLAHRDKLTMSASVDGSIKVWTPPSLPKYMSLVGHKAAISCAVWDAKGFASASEDLSILIWPHDPRAYVKQAKSTKKGKNQDAEDTTVSPVATLYAHTAKISSLAFSTDGLRMVSASHDKSVIVWDLVSYSQLQHLQACHKDWINACTFSDTSPDILLTASNDLTLKLWDLKAGTEKTTFKGHLTAINSVAFSQGCIVSSAFDGSVKVWTHKGVEITTMYCHQQRVNACLLDIPNAQAAPTSTDWADAPEDGETSSSEDQQKVKLDKITVLTASDDGTVGVWKPFLPNEVIPLTGHSDRVLSATATVNNEIVSSALDGTVRIWAPALPIEQQQGNIAMLSSAKGHTGPISSCSLSAKGDYAVTAGRDGTCTLWSLKSDEEGSGLKLECVYTVKVSDRALSSVSYCGAKGDLVAIGGDDGALSFYNFPPGDYASVEQVIMAGTLMGDFPVQRLALTPNEKLLVAGSWSKKVLCMQTALTKGKRLITATMAQHGDWVTDVIAREEDGTSVSYSVGLDSCLYRWVLPTTGGQGTAPASSFTAVKYNIPLPNEGRQKVWLKTICDAGQYIVIGDSEGGVTLWNKDAKKVCTTKKVHQKAINAVAMLGNNLATGSDDSTVKIWKVMHDPAGLKEVDLKQIGHFYTRSCVTMMTSWCGTKKNQLPLLLVGDSLGHLTILQWYQSLL
eukprot:Em0009g1018a